LDRHIVVFCIFDAGEEISAVFFPLAMLSQYFFGPVLFVISLFIVLIILLQRGRGGGLTGALGGAGGASAFGVKAGDIFTRITAVAVLLWIVLCTVTCFWYLPSKLNIATTPSALSTEKSGSGMGGLGSSDSGMAEPSKGDPLVPATADLTPDAGKPINPDDLPPAAPNIPFDSLDPPKRDESGLPEALAPQATDATKDPSPVTPKP